MKKTILVALMATTLFACKQNETKTETATTTAATGTVTTTGPEVDLIKKAVDAFASGDWATYAACYADTAKAYHNIWPLTGDSTLALGMPKLIEGFKTQRALMDGNPSVDGTIYEVVTMPNGSKYGHAWINFSWKSKKGGTGKMALFNSYGFNKDGKITYEWPIYDTKEISKLGQ